jgi:uncharacterized membrane protein
MQITYNYLENGTLALAAFASAIMAGFFYAYTFKVNLAMLLVDGETYAIMQSLFNVNVRHVMFFIFFFGTGAVAAVAVAANWQHYRQLSFWLIVAAGLLYIFGIIVFTANVNLPLNYYTESWNPQALPQDWQATRDAWNQANAFRVFISFTAPGLYLTAFVTRASA